MIYLTGGAAVPNYGDELIVDSWLRWYIDQNAIDPSRITASGSFAKVFDRLFGQRYPGLRTAQSMRPARFRYRDEGFVGIAMAGYRYLDDPAHRTSALMEELEGTSLFHLHGGGYLNTNWPVHAFHVGIGAWAKDNLGAKLVGTGLGLGPLPDFEGDDATAVRKIFSRFDVLEVRDDWSLEYLLRNRFHDAPVGGLDDAFLQAPPARKVPGSVLHISAFHQQAVEQLLEQMPGAFVEAFDRVAFWICTNADGGVFATFASRYPATEPLTVDTLLTGIPVGEANFMVTHRFHPHLMGARLGMNGVYVSGSQYYDVKHGSLVALGSPFTNRALSGLTPSLIQSRKPPAKDWQLIERKRRVASRFLPRARSAGELVQRTLSRTKGLVLPRVRSAADQKAR